MSSLRARFLVLALLLLPLLLQPVHSASSADDDVVGSNNNSTGIYDCSTCRVQDAVLFPWFVQLLGCVVLFLLTHFNIPFPFAAVMFILGAFMGAGVFYSDNDNSLADSIKQWANIDSHLVFLIFLPGLLFKEAVEFNFNMFLVGLPQILILAFPMVLMGTVMTAVVCVKMLPYDFPVAAAATLGAILASTDPIAVASVLKTSGASPRLVTHIAGESLLNDGSAIVFFTLFSRIVYEDMGILPKGTDAITVANGISLFFEMSLGGTAIGLAFAMGLLGVLWQLDRRLEREFDVLQVVAGLATAYLCFYVSDKILHMSGIAACVTLGIVVNAYGRGMINDEKLMGNYLTLVRTTLSVRFDWPDQMVPERLTYPCP
jgi:NhaP-type Na+/H+ or K+/H+ antiporter